MFLSVSVIEVLFTLLLTNAQLQVATTIGADLAARVVDVCAEQLEQFSTTYKRQSLLHYSRLLFNTLP